MISIEYRPDIALADAVTVASVVSVIVAETAVNFAGLDSAATELWNVDRAPFRLPYAVSWDWYLASLVARAVIGCCSAAMS